MLTSLHYIYFFYGLAFFLFGYSILHYPIKNTLVKCTVDLRLLGVFGIIHGISEWFALAGQLEWGTAAAALHDASVATMAASYAALLYFALTLLWPRRGRIVFGLFAAVWIASAFAMEWEIGGRLNSVSRYVLGAPAIFLTSYLFYRGDVLAKGGLYTEIRRYVRALAAVFFIYGILAGLIVPPDRFFPASVINTASFEAWIGQPVPLFRALCAVAASHLIVRIFDLFRIETENRLLKLSAALQQSGDSVMITDADGTIEYVNTAFERQSGFSANEAIGRKPNLLKSGEHDEPFYAQLWDKILSGDNFQGVLVNQAKNGIVFYEYKTIVPLKNGEGKIINFVSTGKDLTERIKTEHALARAASTDPLTGLANRLQCDRWLATSFEKARGDAILTGLILFDIDDFKQVNDRYGHLVGDEVLVEIGSIVRQALRESDMVARWGGEEFMIIQRDTTFEGAIRLAERIRRQIADHRFHGPGHVTVSLGIALYARDATIEAFVKRADDALYEAKKQGKNRYAIAHSERNEETT